MSFLKRGRGVAPAPAPIPTVVTAETAVAQTAEGNPSAPFQLMDHNGVVTSEGKLIMTRMYFSGGRKDFYVISVLGAQGSGKSSFLNRLFGTKFTTGAGQGKVDTQGIWASCTTMSAIMGSPSEAPSATSDQPKTWDLLVLDVEGSDCATADANDIKNDVGNRTSSQVAFEKIASAFVMQVSNIIYLNVTASALGQFHGNGSALLEDFLRGALVGARGIAGQVGQLLLGAGQAVAQGAGFAQPQNPNDVGRVYNNGQLRVLLADYVSRDPAIVWIVRDHTDPRNFNESVIQKIFTDLWERFFSAKTLAVMPSSSVSVRGFSFRNAKAVPYEEDSVEENNAQQGKADRAFEKELLVVRDHIRERLSRPKAVAMSYREFYATLRHIKALLEGQPWAGTRSEMLARSDCKFWAERIMADFGDGTPNSRGAVKLLKGDEKFMEATVMRKIDEWMALLQDPSKNRPDVIITNALLLGTKLREAVKTETQTRRERQEYLQLAWRTAQEGGSLTATELTKIRSTVEDARKEVLKYDEEIGAAGSQALENGPDPKQAEVKAGLASSIAAKAQGALAHNVLGSKEKLKIATEYLELVMLEPSTNAFEAMYAKAEVEGFWSSLLQRMRMGLYIWDWLLKGGGVNAAVTAGQSAVALQSSLSQIMSLGMMVWDIIQKTTRREIK